MAKKEEPKVVDVRVQEVPGRWIDKVDATVTLDNGITGKASGVDAADAIQRASNEAKDNAYISRWFWGD